MAVPNVRFSGDRIERRLFIDTDFWAHDSTGFEVEGTPLARLESLVMLLVGEVSDGAAGPCLRFDDDSQLTISNEANATTVDFPWWLGAGL